MLKTGDSSAKHRKRTVLDRMLDSSTYLRIRDEAKPKCLPIQTSGWWRLVIVWQIRLLTDARGVEVFIVHCSLFRVLFAGVMEIVLFRSLRLCGAYGRNRTGMVIGACIHYQKPIFGRYCYHMAAHAAIILFPCSVTAPKATKPRQIHCHLSSATQGRFLPAY